MAEFTPMMQQYLKIKENCRDAILFYRLGDFYEMFFDDAKTASRELELVLTGRDCGQEERAPMCGIPYHAADTYIARLIAKGYKVAVCEQAEDPALAKGIVKREIIRVVTPGTVTENVMLDEAKNNYLAFVYLTEDRAGLSFCDISTGELHIGEEDGKETIARVIDEVARFSPAEIVVNDFAVTDKVFNAFLAKKSGMTVSVRNDEFFAYDDNFKIVSEHFDFLPDAVAEGGMREAVGALGSMLCYLRSACRNSLDNINEIKIYNENKYLSMNAETRRNLELTETERRREKKGSLLWVLDKTKTPMGKRKIRSWVEQPLIKLTAVTDRQDAVEELFNKSIMRDEITDVLSGISDLERIMTRIIYASANAREVKTLAQSIEALPDVKKLLGSAKCRLLRNIYDDIDTLDSVKDLAARAIVDDPPFSVREGGMIRDGYNAELDSLRNIVNGGKDFLAEIERKEQEKTGIKKLRIGYNRVFGYYIEVLNSFRDYVPDNYIRKQTLTSCERYITPELKELEAKVLGAQERIEKLEYELFADVRGKIGDKQRELRKTAAALSSLDALCSLSSVAAAGGYVRPEIKPGGSIVIKDGRHPVVEKFLDGAPFVPNDTLLDTDENRTLIITGPNMAGKSTYMRQTAIIVLMAQLGSFVPAKSAEIGMVDSIFTRVGASDDLVGGQSTFMTEMNEVAAILSNATKNSLIIFDEIGRGTSTYDGMSIARAVLEFVTDKKKIGAKTLFATHYHELTELEGKLDGVKNYNVSVKKRGDDITFLRRIVRGPADGSYGIEVAKLSGVPVSVVNRAKVILKQLEKDGVARERVKVTGDEKKDDYMQVQMFSDMNLKLLDEIRELDVDTLTPIEALTKLYEIKKRIV